MDEDGEEFYDSLEEDQNFDDAKQELYPEEVTEPKNEEIPESKNKEVPKEEKEHLSKTKVKKDPSKVTKIPLYVGEINKEDLKIDKKQLQRKTSTLSNTCMSCEFSGIKNKFKPNVSFKKNHSSSYWGLYCQKNGITAEEYRNSTNRNFSSYMSNFCLSAPKWNASSVFEKYVPKTYGNQTSEIGTFEEQDFDRSSNYGSAGTTSIKSIALVNFKSVSEIDISNAPSLNISTSNKLNIKSKSNTSSVIQSSVRKLTSNSKLDLLRRKQDYGLKVSNRNRAKIIQNLSKLKQELEDNEGSQIP